jgi:CDP-6-deoxy-D-xylo-4-hexulose-3-dehydrase
MSWKDAVKIEWLRRRGEDDTPSALFPLAMNPFGSEEILAMTDVLLSGRLTLGEKVDAAEREFAKIVGSPFAMMVNSGSSANLLAVAAITNKLRKNHCEVGDEVLVPAVCWSTSVFPLLQCGLKPVFVDVNPQTFNVDINELEKKISSRVKAVMAVHVLGNSTCIIDLMNFISKYNLILIEDTCEALGTFSEGKRMLGTYGDFGTYSFYFSHHITSGEGGMVVCKTEDDYNLIRCLRAHGWTRHLTNREEVEASHPDIDPRFLFVNMGFNLRPMEVQGAMLSVQLRKLAEYNTCRRDNFSRIQKALHSDQRFSKYMSLMEASDGTDPAWFGIGALLHRAFAHQLRDYLLFLSKNGIENRPIISGNFTRQPCIATYCSDENPENYPSAEALHSRGFFIGVHQVPVSDAKISKLVDIMLSFPFKAQRVVLVTGSSGMLGRYIQNEVVHQEVVDTKWIWVSRKDGDLTNSYEVENLFKKHQPTHVLHLAAKLASIQEMTAKPVDFWIDNVSINNNILQTAHKFQRWVGPVKVVSVLSTVMFPKDASFPVGSTDDELFSGRLHEAAESYAFAKRALAQLSNWYNKQHGVSFVSILPSNFFGAYGDFNPKTAPLVNALIAKSEAARKNHTSLLMMGSGNQERQIMYAADLARAAIWVLDNYEDTTPLIVASDEFSIRYIAELVCEATGFTGDLVFDKQLVEGPLRRTADTSRFSKLCPDFKFTPLSEAIKETVSWYRSHQ